MRIILGTVIAGLACIASAESTYYFKERISIDRVPGAYLALRSDKGKLPSSVTASRFAVAPYVSLDKPVRDGSVAFLTPVYRDDHGGIRIPTQTLLIKFRGLNDDAAQRRLWQNVPQIKSVSPRFAGLPGVWRVVTSVPTGEEVLALAERLTLRPDVEFCEPDMIFTGSGGLDPNDPGYPLSWGIRNSAQFNGAVAAADTRGFLAWNQTLGSPSVVTVVIDTGVQQDHPDLNQVTGRDFTSDGNALQGGPVNNFDNHGTAVASCVSALINNGIGTVGIASGTKSASARCFISTNANGNWTAQYSWTANALAWAQSIGARITNNSNIYGATPAVVTTAYQVAEQNGLLSFACAGNDGSASLAYPASLPTVQAVAALDWTGVKATFSQYGTGLDFIAPGRNIYSCDRTGASGYTASDYAYVTGTSFASPMTAGLAALVWSVNPGLTNAEVRQLLADTAYDLGTLGYDTVYGSGLVRADWAVQRAGALPTVVTPYTVTSDRGILLSGNATSLATGDPDFLKYRKGLVVNANDPPVRIMCQSYQPLATLSSATIKTSLRVSTGGLKQTIEAYDWLLGAYTVVDVRPASIAFQTVEVPVANPGTFRDPVTGVVRWRLSLVANGPVGAADWTVDFDSSTATVSP